jgi:hypothetical protein
MLALLFPEITLPRKTVSVVPRTIIHLACGVMCWTLLWMNRSSGSGGGKRNNDNYVMKFKSLQ